jgi:hypothetical protein
MRTYWENIEPKEAVDRALWGGTFIDDRGKTIIIEGAMNVFKRLYEIPIEQMSEDQLKELGVAIHTLQDSKVHKGARWVDKHDKEAKKMNHKNGHPDSDCIGGKNSVDAYKATKRILKNFKHNNQKSKQNNNEKSDIKKD